jgi:hypothetical protein
VQGPRLREEVMTDSNVTLTMTRHEWETILDCADAGLEYLDPYGHGSAMGTVTKFQRAILEASE